MMESLQKRMGAIEAILYVAGEPVEEEALRMALEVRVADVEEALLALEARYDEMQSGIRLLRFGRSVQLSTRPVYAEYVERLLQPIQRQNLSQAAMETLAVIAYRQPATRGDVEAVRGVKCDYSVQSLVIKGLIEEIGRRDTLGRPALFATTDLFLRHFGISSLDELPTIDFTVQEESEDAEDVPGADLHLVTPEEGGAPDDGDTPDDGGDSEPAVESGGPEA